MEATKETARELGMQWGGIWRSGSFDNGNHAWIDSGASGTQGQDPITDGLTGTHGSGPGGAPFGLDYSDVVSNDMGSLGFLFSKVGGGVLEVQLNLMEKGDSINILSSPFITTLDDKMAYTGNSEKVPYVSTSNMGNREVKFEDTVLHLEMMPNVIDDDNLKLKVLTKEDEVDTSRSVDGDPFIIKKQTETTLIMHNGETVVISDLTKEKGTDINANVPGLKDVSDGKYVFDHESKGKMMGGVLILVTPKVLPVRELPPLPSAPPISESPSLQNGALPAPSTGATRR